MENFTGESRNETEELLNRTGYSTSRGGHFNEIHIPRKINKPRLSKTTQQAIAKLMEEVSTARSKLNPFSTQPQARIEDTHR